MKIKNKNKNFSFGANAATDKDKKVCLAVINKLLLFLIASGGIYFMLSINDLSVKGFVLRDLKIKSEELSDQNRLIETKITDLESYEDIQRRAISMNLVRVDKVDYIAVTGEQVAKR